MFITKGELRFFYSFLAAQLLADVCFVFLLLEEFTFAYEALT